MSSDDPRTWGNRQPPPSGAPPDPEATRLYNIYSGWTAQLHTWVANQLQRHIDCEFVPADWEFKIYSGEAGASISSSGIPHVMRPAGERVETVHLLTPEELPDDEDLDFTFRTLCLAAARVLKLKVGEHTLDTSKTLPAPVKQLRDDDQSDNEPPF